MSTATLFPEPTFDVGRLADHFDPQPNPYAADPIGWIHDELSEETWSKQDEVLLSLRDNRFTDVRSAHSTGKSHIASRAVAWWVDTHPVDDLFVVTTAPSTNQVAGILWRYIRSLHRKHDMVGYITGGDVPQWKVGDQQLIGWGRKPQDLTNEEQAATVFQGIHARYLLVVIDEVGGVPQWLLNAINTLVSDEGGHSRVLAIGNPDDPSSAFASLAMPGNKWHDIKIDAFCSPNFIGDSRYTGTPEMAAHDSEVSDRVKEQLVGPTFVNDSESDWGEESPLYISKVLAEFPEVSDDNLIPVGWVRAAMERDLGGSMIGVAGKFSMDVARTGKDESTLARIRGNVFRMIRSKIGLGDLMRNVGWLSEANREVPAAKIIVDADGLGSGVFDRAKELKLPVSAFHGGHKAYQPKKFNNRRSEQWWHTRFLFQDGLIDIDPKDTKLQAQLTSIKWSLDSKGRVRVETKEEMQRRGLPSPDRGDTLMMATAPDTDWSDAYSDPADVGQEREPDTVTGDLLTKQW